jgi:hypothetical protein
MANISQGHALSIPAAGPYRECFRMDIAAVARVIPITTRPMRGCTGGRAGGTATVWSNQTRSKCRFGKQSLIYGVKP